MAAPFRALLTKRSIALNCHREERRERNELCRRPTNTDSSKYLTPMSHPCNTCHLTDSDLGPTPGCLDFLREKQFVRGDRRDVDDLLGKTRRSTESDVETRAR